MRIGEIEATHTFDRGFLHCPDDPMPLPLHHDYPHSPNAWRCPHAIIEQHTDGTDTIGGIYAPGDVDYYHRVQRSRLSAALRGSG